MHKPLMIMEIKDNTKLHVKHSRCDYKVKALWLWGLMISYLSFIGLHNVPYTGNHYDDGDDDDINNRYNSGHIHHTHGFLKFSNKIPVALSRTRCPLIAPGPRVSKVVTRSQRLMTNLMKGIFSTLLNCLSVSCSHYVLCNCTVRKVNHFKMWRIR